MQESLSEQDELISVRAAYLAMYSFLDELYSKNGFDQLGGLLGCMSLVSGMPADLAVWSDWLEAVKRARNDQVDADLRFTKE